MAIKYSNNFGNTTAFSFNSPCFNIAANVENTYTVPGSPTQKFQALFSFNANSNVFVGYNSTATVPTANTPLATGRMEFKPFERYVQGGDVLHFITPDTNAYFGVSFRLLP